MRIGWASDLHLEFVDRRGLRAFVEGLKSARLERLLITGDIGQAPTVVSFLADLSFELRIPIYFVLGNHDFYRGSIRKVRETIGLLCADTPTLVWLPNTGLIPLSSDTVLLGHDSWYDYGCGEPSAEFRLNDFELIAELKGLSAEEEKRASQRLAQEAVDYVSQQLPLAMATYRRVFLALHVPPYQEAALYEGRLSDSYAQPYFICRTMGETIRAVAARFPNSSVTVLCGHTHHQASLRVLPNVEVLVASAEYGKPVLAKVFEV